MPSRRRLPLSHSLSGQSSPMARSKGGNSSEAWVISMMGYGMMGVFYSLFLRKYAFYATANVLYMADRPTACLHYSGCLNHYWKI